MAIQDEILKLRSISNTGLALVDFVRSIHPKGDFSQETKSWVYRPDNFVVFDIHYQRANSITLSLRGSPSEFQHYEILPLSLGMGHVYSRCKIENPNQLDAASYYIRRALELYKRGRTRPHKEEKRIER